MFSRIDHVGIACHDLDVAVAFYRDTFGFSVSHEEVNEEQGVREAMLRANGTDDGQASYIQLLQPLKEDSPVGKFLARNGEGVHHIAFGTDDVAAAGETMRDRGLRTLSEHPRNGSMDSSIMFLHPKDCGGVLTEMVQAPTTETHQT